MGSLRIRLGEVMGTIYITNLTAPLLGNFSAPRCALTFNCLLVILIYTGPGRPNTFCILGCSQIRQKVELLHKQAFLAASFAEWFKLVLYFTIHEYKIRGHHKFCRFSLSSFFLRSFPYPDVHCPGLL